MTLAQPYGPITEGYDAEFVPSVAYVQQGDKVWFMRGTRNLTESVDASVTVVESIDQLELVEREGKKYVKDGRYYVEGTYQRSDTPNANKRFYPREIWERTIADPKSSFMENVRGGGVVGHMEHPTDGRTDSNKVAMKHLDFKLLENGVVWGRSMLTSNTPGRELASLTDDGVRWGVSSRGAGSVGADGKVSPKDFNLETFDAVMRPSTPGAYPTAGSPKKVSEEDYDGDNVDLSEAVDQVTKTKAHLNKGLKGWVSVYKQQKAAGNTAGASATKKNIDTVIAKHKLHAPTVYAAEAIDTASMRQSVINNGTKIGTHPDTGNAYMKHTDGDVYLITANGNVSNQGDFKSFMAKVDANNIKFKPVKSPSGPTESELSDEEVNLLNEGFQHVHFNGFESDRVSLPKTNGGSASMRIKRLGKYGVGVLPGSRGTWALVNTETKKLLGTHEDDRVLARQAKALHAASQATPNAAGDEKKNESSLDDAATCIEEVTALTQLDTDALDESEQTAMAARMVKSLGRVNSLDKSETLARSKANELRDWLTTKLGEIYRGAPPKAKLAGLTESASGSNQAGKDAAYLRTVSALQKSVNDAVREAADQRELAAAHLARAEEAEAALEKERELRQRAVESASKAGIKLGETTRKLAQALASIEELTKGEVEDPIKVAVAEVVEGNPLLEDVRDLLEKSESPERVYQLAETLSAKSIGGGNGAGRTRANVARSTLPVGIIVSESIPPANHSTVGNSHHGANAAARALSRMNAVRKL